MVYRQMLTNPLSAIRHNSTWIFPGYPPSPAFRYLRERAVLYVHDLFLLTRRQDLNFAARFYMAPAFRQAIASLRYFLVNSAATQRQLSRRVSGDAHIQLYRPRVDNVFGLNGSVRPASASNRNRLIVGALGTIEPRKNFTAGASICACLAEILGYRVEFHVVGRRGWGDDFERLSKMPHVKLHGFLPDDQARRVIESFDLFLCTSHDEGLGLPLLEMQYAGIPVVAPDDDIFHEVLGSSGIYIPTDTSRAAAAIALWLQRPDWRSASAAGAKANVARWNQQADVDRVNVVAFLTDMKGRLARCG
jgi:glycosyltransferase involved in cell wall biosynthesis